MASIKSNLFAFILRITNSKISIEKQFATGNFGVRDCPEPPESFFNKYLILRKKSNGRTIMNLHPKKLT